MKNKKLLSAIICIILVAVIAIFAVTYNKDKTSTPTDGSQISTVGGTVLGEGATKFTFTVTDAQGIETEFEIHTDKTIVGEALMEVGLIDGEQGPYGLYVKTVNGVTLDYDKDGKYWAFYINGEYAMSGVDMTPITAGEAYEFKAE